MSFHATCNTMLVWLWLHNVHNHGTGHKPRWRNEGRVQGDEREGWSAQSYIVFTALPDWGSHNFTRLSLPPDAMSDLRGCHAHVRTSQL